MSHSPLLSRLTPGAPEPNAFLPLPVVHTNFAATENESDEIVDTLRNAISAGASALDPILTAIAEAAQTLTAASAAVVALRGNGVVVCRARSGDSAPEVGSPLSEKSGISGECLRTGKTLRCDDTQKDYRVNPEVCRRLGLRSIAVLPLRSRLEIAGVLEVFSTRAYAFGEAQMTLLGRLAELVEAAYTQELSTQASVKPAPVKKAPDLVPLSQAWTHPNETALRRVGRQVTAEDLRGEGKSRRRVGIAAVLLVVVSGLAWTLARRPQHEVAAVPTPVQTQAPAQPQAEVAEADDDSIPISLTDITSRPEGEAGAGSGMAVSIQRHPRQDSEPDPEISDVVTRKADSETQTSPAADAVPPGKPGALIASSLREPEPAPKLETAAANESSALGSLLTAPAVVPQFSAPVSQGVSGGTLEHKVQPIYPHQAIATKLEGLVTLEAVITPEGKVGNVKVVKGHPILGQAAIDAVRQWRYRPYELNGQPVSMQAEIVVNFQAPK